MSNHSASSEAQPGAGAPAPRGRFLRILQILCLLYAAFVLVENVQQVAWDIGRGAGQGDLGAAFGKGDERGQSRVAAVTPGGPMATAGVLRDDKVRFDRPYDIHRHIRAGEAVGFTVWRAGQARHAVIRAAPEKPAPLTTMDELGMVYNLATALAAVIAAFIVWRGGGTSTTLLLGMAMMTYGLITPEAELLFSAPAIYPFGNFVGDLNLAVIPILFYAFSLRFYEDCVAPLKRWAWIAFWAFAVVQLVTGELYAYYGYTTTAIPGIGMGALATTITTYVGFVICFAYLIVGWRRSQAAVQQRYALMLVATAAIMVAQGMDSLTTVVESLNATQGGALGYIHLIVNSILTGIVGSGLFAYSVLRHKVFDLGFAVNRTLVYGVVSALLLAAFGLIEWAVDHFVPIEGREKNALVDAAIAVGVFLTFHRVRDFVEHGVEGLFFRRWQTAEQALRRFVRDAPFITESGALVRASIQALSRFGEEAPCAIYLTGEGVYVLAGGEIIDAPKSLETNLPELVRVRADLKPVEIEDGVFAGGLAAPMVNRNEVTGVAIMAPKPNGVPWRPDEIELIGWAVSQIGLDLHALQVEQLNTVAAELRQEVATLRSLIPKRA